MRAIMGAFVVVAVLIPAHGFSCYYGTSTSDSPPSTTANGCWQCSKFGTKAGSTTIYTFGGICTNYPTLPTVAYTAYTGSITVPSVTAGSCQWYAAGGGLGALVNGAAAATGGTNYCLSTTSINTCSSQWDSGISATCVCCSDKCNSASICSLATTTTAAPLTTQPVQGYYYQKCKAANRGESPPLMLLTLISILTYIIHLA